MRSGESPWSTALRLTLQRLVGELIMIWLTTSLSPSSNNRAPTWHSHGNGRQNVRRSHFGPRIDGFDGSMALACSYQTSGTSPSRPVFGSARVPDVLRVTSGRAVTPFFLERLYLPGSGLEFSGRCGPDTPLGARLLTESQRVEQVVASDGKSPENIFIFATCKRTSIPAR